MSTCARCGLEQDAGELTRLGNCALPQSRLDACRDRELANLRSLLRSVTGKLEEAAELLNHDGTDAGLAASKILDDLLEVLS